MTTIACNLKEMAADTRVTWEGVSTDVYSSIKIYQTRDALYGITGEDCTGSLLAIDWLKSGAPKDFRPESKKEWDWKIIELSASGIAVFNTSLERELTLEPMMAVGSGRKVALYCMKYLGMSPAEAVREACKVDHWSEVPVYQASLKGAALALWKPSRRKKAK